MCFQIYIMIIKKYKIQKTVVFHVHILEGGILFNFNLFMCENSIITTPHIVHSKNKYSCLNIVW